MLFAKKHDGTLTAEIIDFKTDRVTRENTGHYSADVPTHEEANGNTGNSSSMQLIAEAYKLQMQLYALAVRRLLPQVNMVSATLHFLEADGAYSYPDSDMDFETCKASCSRAISNLAAAERNRQFQPHVGVHCRRCGFLEYCIEGKSALAQITKI
jgi:hypothetical protein